MESKQWYHNWFNSPYYHILYHQRNDAEAEFFIDNLVKLLDPPLEAYILDIACGRGRHAIYLNKKGYDVTGIDLSVANIKYALQFENSRLHFMVHDMRHLFYINYFDIALNLFTSFGYFDREKEHVNALKTFHKSIRKDGIFVMDYMNSAKIIEHLVLEEIKIIENISFDIIRQVKGGNIIKMIHFEDKGQHFSFGERVKAFNQEDFERMFKLSGFRIIEMFGDYSLRPYSGKESDRLIFICKKQDA